MVSNVKAKIRTENNKIVDLASHLLLAQSYRLLYYKLEVFLLHSKKHIGSHISSST